MLPAVRKLSFLVWKKTVISSSPTMIGRLPTSPARTPSHQRERWARTPFSSCTTSEAATAVVASDVMRLPRSLPRPVVVRRLGDPGDFRRHAGSDCVDDLLLGRLFSLEDGDAAAQAQDGDPRRDLEDVVQVVRDDHHREALLGEPLHELEHLAGLGHAERGRRLVEDHEARVPHHRARDRDRLALAAGEARDLLPRRADRRDGEAFHRLGRLRLHLGLPEPPDHVVVLAAEVHVLDDVEVVAQREILVDDLDPERGGVLRAVDRDLLPLEEDLALVERVDARETLDQRRLAGAVVADERHHLARADLEVDVGQGLDRAEALRDPLHHECRHVGHGGVASQRKMAGRHSK